MADTEITTAMLLQHLQGMEQRLLSHVERLDQKVDGVEERLTNRIHQLDAKLDRVDANLTRQIDGIDKRLDAIEIERLPARTSRIERQLGLAA